MTSVADLDRGRTAYAEHRWNDAVRAWTAADQAGGLLAEDLERFSTAALLIGQETIGIDIATRAHEEFLAIGDVTGAARSAGWIGLYLLSAGDMARSAGWLARAQRVFQTIAEPSPVEGLLLIAAALDQLYSGDPEGAAGTFDDAFAIADHFGDLDLMALAQLGQGQAKIMLGKSNAGLSLLDEVMVAVTAGEISPVPSGMVYCGVIGSCHLAFDLRRAHEWTIALDHWCGGRPDMVLFSGVCQTHRAELYVLHGAWTDALAAARAALDRARRGDRNSVSAAWYQQGEVQRLRGEFDAADESYRQANQAGFEPEPGLALLCLAQGKPQLAQSLIRRALDGVDPATRRQLLPGLVEIELAAGDVAAARQGADELAAMAEAGAVPMAQAIADQCEGAVLLAAGDDRRALTRLRRAWTLWQQLDAPYEAARCRVLTARACRGLGDEDSALMELEAARAVFAELGAGAALVEVVALSRANSDEAAGRLTPREVEVLRLVSTGKTNRAVAAELYLSEKTVARHLSNLFMKLGLSSRSAATAYAYEHGLV